MNKLFIENVNVRDKRVIVRVDYNVPLKDGQVTDDNRIRASIPTVEYLLKNNAKIILMSHLGRPKGKTVDTLRLKPVAEALAAILGRDVKYIDDCIGEKVQLATESLQQGEILLLENLRFYPEEEKNDPAFAAELGKLADIYVNDAFGTAHRAHASTAGIARHMKKSACGYLLRKELEYLGNAVSNPRHPFIAIIGGAKISGKIDVIESLLPRVDKLLIGGAMTFTFLKAMGKETGKSLVEEDKIDLAKRILDKAGDKILFPVDFLVSDSLDFDSGKIGSTEVCSADAIPFDMMGLDIGPDSITAFEKALEGVQTVLWNGPMGVFEIEETARGTFAMAHSLVKATENGAITIIGGGDSAAAVAAAGLEDKVSHVSTGGGASLEFLEGKELPGVSALSDA